MLTPRAYPTQLPPAFWDKLSEVPLTKNAIRELERRNANEFCHAQSLRTCPPRRPFTQRSATQYLARIKRFARRGGPDLSVLRGVVMNNTTQSHLVRPKHGSVSASESTPTLPPTSTKKTSPYDRAFQQLLIDYGIYPDGYEYPNGQVLRPPGNLEEIMQAMVKRRPSLSSSRFQQEDFEHFKRADRHAFKEPQVMSTVIPIIEGRIKDGRSVAGQVPLTNLEDPTIDLLVPGNPDRYYGARPEQLDRQVRTQLGKHIVPSTQHDLPIVPNFFLNVKGLNGTLAVAKNQACYNGALGARGMNSLQIYADLEFDSDNKAYTLTSTYYGGLLTIYASYPLLRASLQVPHEYAMVEIDAYILTRNIDTFRAGVSAYRNARDWAKQKRDEAIKRANETAVRDRGDT
ncbi:hypothetical protein HD806DRAFT_526295 [Xylariaceae sp. AK1471]|nr:hypothetical protein HD806DRAFT_526295 [Xylariaceae sp. AK1471]